MSFNLKLNKVAPKRIQISKAQSTMMAATVVATIITVFCLVSVKSLVAQARFQSHVISARRTASQQLQDNVTTAKTLDDQYNQVFEGGSTTNLIGGRNDTSPNAIPPDGDNGRLVLDALPTSYDFPALLTSLSKLLAQDGLGSPSIGGSDQSSTVNDQPVSNPQPANIDIAISGTGSASNIQSLIKDLERSIRPFNITKVSLNGSETNMTVNITATTYYQPGKTLNLNTKEVR
ncbi:MAG TPA: hypothetical protein VFP32_02145 [Candidatus Saccharimonadales bacterium]|nr:hypothetical protein [Candidatus Saccharimonadales bacterium]